MDKKEFKRVYRKKINDAANEIWQGWIKQKLHGLGDDLPMDFKKLVDKITNDYYEFYIVRHPEALYQLDEQA